MWECKLGVVVSVLFYTTKERDWWEGEWVIEPIFYQLESKNQVVGCDGIFWGVGGGFEGATKTNKIFKSGWGVASFWGLWVCRGGFMVGHDRWVYIRNILS